MNMEVLKRSRRPVKAGDIFVYRIKGRPFGYGRVIRTDAKIGVFDDDVIMIYIYNAFSPSMEAIPILDKDRLLFPPVGIFNRLWTLGFFQTVENRPLTDADVHRVHCFDDMPFSRYCDEYGNKLPRRTEPCGLFAVDSECTIDRGISRALGIPPSPDTLPERKPKKPRGRQS